MSRAWDIQTPLTCPVCVVATTLIKCRHAAHVLRWFCLKEAAPDSKALRVVRGHGPWS